jgi:hypothetical protein
MSEDGKFRVEKFNGQNYQLWKMQMEDYLYKKDIFLPLGEVAKKSTAIKDEEWEILEKKALGTIWLSLAMSMAFNISKEKIMKDLMDVLAKLYEKPSTSNKVFLMKRLFNMIQVDVGGHPPFPNGSKQFSGHFGNLLFLAGFHFRGHFEGLNEVFSRSRFSMIAEGMIEPPK